MILNICFAIICKVCSGTVSNCDVCFEDFYFYENKCYSQCSELNDQLINIDKNNKYHIIESSIRLFNLL